MKKNVQHRPSPSGLEPTDPFAMPDATRHHLQPVRLLAMKQISVAEILELPVQERIRLVEIIWESVAAVPEAVEITPEIKVELERRLQEFKANPDAGYSWEQVKSHLQSDTWRSA